MKKLSALLGLAAIMSGCAVVSPKPERNPASKVSLAYRDGHGEDLLCKSLIGHTETMLRIVDTWYQLRIYVNGNDLHHYEGTAISSADRIYLDYVSPVDKLVTTFTAVTTSDGKLIGHLDTSKESIRLNCSWIN